MRIGTDEIGIPIFRHGSEHHEGRVAGLALI